MAVRQRRPTVVINVKYMDSENNIKLFEEYYDTNVAWWNDTTANFTSIPVGMCGEENYSLFFDEEWEGAVPSSHAFIVGMPGCGKSSLLHTMIVGSCIRYSPEELRLTLIDMKSAEFRQYEEEQLPHVDIVASKATPEVGCHILQSVCKEIHERENLFREKRVSNYYQYRRTYPEDVLPRYMIIIDEYGELMLGDLRKEVLYYFDLIIARGRPMGFNLVLSSQTMDLPDDMVLYGDYKSEPFKIVMRSNPLAAKSLLGFEDDRASQLKVGQALIHTKTIHLVQCYYLAENVRCKPEGAFKMRSDYLIMIRERWDEKHTVQGNYLPI